MQNTFIALRPSPRVWSALALVAATSCGQPGGANDGEKTAAPSASGGSATALAATPAPSPSASPESDDNLAPLPTEKFTGGAQAFADAKAALLSTYYEGGISEDDLYRAAVQGMLEHIEPRMRKWNKLMTPTEVSEIKTDLKGELVGIGVVIKFDADSGYTTVNGIIPGSPAERAGLVQGDTLVSVNGKLYKGRSLRDVVAEIRGKAGASVTLSVLRGDKLMPLTITREVVNYDSATSMVLPDGTGYLHIGRFSEKTAAAVKASLDDLAKKNARALIVDLRGNQGGSFDEAVATAGLLLPPGTPVVSLQKRGEKASPIVAKGQGALATVPLSVLVDGATASGAELLTAALQEGRGAKVVGAKTLGKWSVQTIDDLPNGYAMKFTVGLFHSPSGRSFEGVGLEPDVPVSMEAKAVERAQDIADPAKRVAADAQLRTAVSLVHPL